MSDTTLSKENAGDIQALAGSARKLARECEAFADQADSKPLLSPSNGDIKKLIVAVHGIGDQKRFATIQSVAHRLGEYLGVPGKISLGAFHSDAEDKKNGAAGERSALSLRDYPAIGLAEVFWADIPKEAQKREDTLEETKAWALTVVERLRRKDHARQHDTESVDYDKTRAVVSEMIETIATLENLLLIANKAGLGKFELKSLLDDYLGDVQIVAEFRDYGGRVFREMQDTMSGLMARYKSVEEIYIIAHSEGTVVSFRALLEALACGHTWVEKVRGFMTIGSPIDKHIVLWPRLWEDYNETVANECAHRISEEQMPALVWWNYYDYGDPVGFKLDSAQRWLKDNGWWPRFFDFRLEQNVGFTRYPLPGKAHTDYWEDGKVFGHFFGNVIKLTRNAGEGRNPQTPEPKPRTRPFALMVSWIFPYVLCLLLLMGGIYALNHALETFVGKLVGGWEAVKSICGIACFLAGITVLSRIPRLTKFGWRYLVAAGVFALGSWAFLGLVDVHIRWNLSLGFNPSLGATPEWRIIVVGLLVAAASAIFSKIRPEWGMMPLMSLGGGTTLISMAGIIKFGHLAPTAKGAPLWPLVLSGLGFLYLWWLVALLFRPDLRLAPVYPKQRDRDVPSGENLSTAPVPLKNNVRS